MVETEARNQSELLDVICREDANLPVWKSTLPPARVEDRVVLGVNNKLDTALKCQLVVASRDGALQSGWLSLAS